MAKAPAAANDELAESITRLVGATTRLLPPFVLMKDSLKLILNETLDLNKAFTGLSEILKKAVPVAITSVTTAVQYLASGASSGVGKILDLGSKLGSAFAHVDLSAVVQPFRTLGGVISGVVSSAVNQFTQTFPTIASALQRVGKDAVMMGRMMRIELGEAFQSVSPYLQRFSPLLTAAFSPLAGLMSKIGSGVIDASKSIVSGVGAVFGQVTPYLQQFGGYVAAAGAKLGSLGSAIGGAVAGLGPAIARGLSSAVSAVSPALKQFGSYVVTVGGALGTAGLAAAQAFINFKKVGFALDQVQNAVYNLVKSVAASAVGSLGEGASKAAGYLQQPMQLLDTAVGQVNQSVARFVQLADPGAFTMFTLAVNDMYATIGQALVPVMQMATDIFRDIGNTLIGLNSDGKQTIQAIAAGTVALITFAVAMEVLEAILTGGLAPVVELLVGGLVGGIAAAAASTGVLTKFMGQFSKVLGGVMESIGAALTVVEPIGEAVFAVLADVGDMFAGFVQEIVGVFADAGGVFQDIIAVGKELYTAVRPLIEGLFTYQATTFKIAIGFFHHMLELIAPPIVILARGLGWLFSTLMEGLKIILSWVGISFELSKARESTAGNSTGAAVTNVRTTGIEQVLKAQLEKSYASGQKLPDGPEQKLISEMGNIVQKTDQLIEQLATFLNELPGKIAEGIVGSGPSIEGVWEGLAELVHGKPTTPPAERLEDFVRNEYEGGGSF